MNKKRKPDNLGEMINYLRSINRELKDNISLGYLLEYKLGKRRKIKVLITLGISGVFENEFAKKIADTLKLEFKEDHYLNISRQSEEPIIKPVFISEAVSCMDIENFKNTISKVVEAQKELYKDLHKSRTLFVENKNERDSNKIPDILDKLKKIWLENPNLRLGQLIENVFKESNIYYMEDNDFIKDIEDYYINNLKDKYSKAYIDALHKIQNEYKKGKY
jgi:hypothetical protein